MSFGNLRTTRKKKETPSFFPHIVTSSIRILKYIEYPTKFSI